MRWSSMNGLLSGGSTAVHIMTVSSAPAAAARRIAIPRINATPTPNRAAMNSTFVMGAPAIEWYNPANGPLAAEPRNPLVGLPPLSHDFAATVLWPRPNVLSRNAQRKIQPRATRIPASRYLAAVPDRESDVVAEVVAGPLRSRSAWLRRGLGPASRSG